MPILKHIARSGDVAIVIEHFSGADRESKGFYTRGVIHLNADKLSEGGYTYTGIHECVHYVAEVNSEGYKAIEKFVENYYKKKGVDIEAEKKATQALYEQRGVKLTSEEAMEEIVCNTLSDIATDADALTAFMGLDSKSRNKFIDALKTLARKLKAWAKTHLAGTKYHDAVIKDADTLLSLAKQLNAELAKAGQKNNTAESSGVKYTFGGENAGTANKSLLFEAERLESEGIDSETIRKETGWFRSYDGKWRFEIDDKAKIEKYVETAIAESRLIYSKEESLESDSYVRYEGYAKSDSSSVKRLTHNEADVNKKSYSFGEEDLDFGLYISEGSGVSESLKDSGRAVGAMLEKTRGAEVDISDVSRVMKNNLKDFGIKGETISANERILEVINLASADSYVDGDAVMGEIAAVMKDTLRNSPYVVGFPTPISRGA